MQFSRLVALSTWGELVRAPLMVQFPPFAGSEVAVRGGEVTVRSGDAPTSPATSPKTLTTGVVGEVSCVLVAAMPGLVCRSHANR